MGATSGTKIDSRTNIDQSHIRIAFLTDELAG